MTGERWRSPESRELVQMIRRAGGRCQGISLGRLLVTGPEGQIAVPEPDTRDPTKVALIQERTGLTLTRS